MNPYTTKTQARIQPHDLSLALRGGPLTAACSLAMLERMRGYQAEAEVAWLLKQHAVPAAPAASRLRLRQRIGAALVRAGCRLVGVSPAPAVPDGPLPMVG
jgi:hypothetical protein